MQNVGPVQKKILLILLGGIALSVTRSPSKQWKILKGLHHEWKKINRQTLERALNSLYKSKLIGEKNNVDGSTTFVLNELGKKRALTYNLETMAIKRPRHWDKKWRIVISDIPEKLKKVREALRFHMHSLGFYPLQKSVFVYPFDCQNEIGFIIEWYQAHKYIRFIVAHSIDNELALKKYFNLL